MGHGGRRTARDGKRVGRPKKEAVPKLRRDVAFEILDLVNNTQHFDLKQPDKPRDEALKKASGEARFAYELMMSSGSTLKWDIYRYSKECVDGKPMVRSEEKVIFDPNQPLRVLVEHIGQPGSRSSHSVAAQAK